MISGGGVMKTKGNFISLISVIFLLLVGMAMGGCGTALTQAAKEGDISALQKLIEEGADINEGAIVGGSMNGSLLSQAAYYCRIEAVKYLIHKGADINNATGWTDYGASGGGLRPLHMAARSGCTEAIKLLLDAGADIDVRANKMFGSALAIAAYHGNIKSVKYLIERGADVDDASQVLKGLADDKMKGRGGKEGLALLQKFEKQKIAIRLSENIPPSIVAKSDVDELPAIKAKLNRNSYAIVIGIESYRQKLPKADYAVADAKAMTEYLTKVMGYPEENVITLINEQATKSDFEKYIEEWLPKNIEPNSSVFIYYSGHGAPNTKTGDAFLVPYDGDPNFIEKTGYPLKKLYDNLSKLQAKGVIVALDSCFSGAGGHSVLAQGSRPLVMNLQTTLSPAKNMIIMAASSGSETSSTYNDKGHGLFTYFMLKGIKGEADMNEDGKIEIEELYQYMKPNVQKIARRLYNNEQTPQLIAPEKQKIFLKD
ncbi:MAG: ankyrin [Nitrospirae bacterium]|nr:MAG: ankyrin [Nitrospirota bacterium]